jgi:hypothetical protein
MLCLLSQSFMGRTQCGKMIQPSFSAQKLLWRLYQLVILHEERAPKITDTWRVENIWSIIKDMAKSREPKNEAHHQCGGRLIQ